MNKSQQLLSISESVKKVYIPKSNKTGIRNYISVRHILPPSEYYAVDPDTNKSQLVKITSIVRDKNTEDEYNVSVKLPDGSSENWYINSKDNVFFLVGNRGVSYE